MGRKKISVHEQNVLQKNFEQKTKGSENTAVEWFYDKIRIHFEQDENVMLDFLKMAKEIERKQHARTWDSAIKAHDDRGHVYARSFVDFDDYEIC
jgi:hypothetical protein